MRLVVSAVAAVGILLVFSGITAPAPAARRGWLASLDAAAADAGWRISGIGLGACCLGIAGLASLVAVAVTASVPAAVCAAVVGAVSPMSWAKKARSRRLRVMGESWPDALSSIIAGARAGMALPECCRALAETGPRDLRPAFGSFASTYAATASFETALRRLSEELHEPIADRVIAVLLMTHQVGGNDLVRVLRTTMEMIREDARIRNEVRARWSWTIAAAKVAAAAPFIVLVMMALRPEGAAAYSSPAGVTTVAAGAVATFVGYQLMLRAARLPEDKRLGS